MLTEPLYDTEHDEKIVDWRCDCFVDRGFLVIQATALAVRRDIDRVLVERLLDQGATHAEVMEIVL
jgi:hypothetical protein